MLKGAIEPWHLIIIVAVLFLLFGAKRLPDASRSLARSMKIFKSEVKDLRNDDEPVTPEIASAPVTPTSAATAPTATTAVAAAPVAATPTSTAAVASEAELREAELRLAEARVNELRAARAATAAREHAEREHDRV